MSDLNYSKLQIQEYLKLEHINTQGAQHIFRYRVRMRTSLKTFVENMALLLVNFVEII